MLNERLLAVQEGRPDDRGEFYSAKRICSEYVGHLQTSFAKGVALLSTSKGIPAKTFYNQEAMGYLALLRQKSPRMFCTLVKR